MVHRRFEARALTTLLLATTGVFLAGAGSASGQVISSVAATNVTDSSAVITWMTNVPASTLVNYGFTASYGYSSALNPALVTTHSVTLNGLSANSLYHFTVSSGNTTSANFRFATLSTSPIIGDINIIYLTSTGVTINWTTDQPSTGMVNYGTTTNYASSTPVISTPTIAHAVTLTGLTPNTTYNFAPVSVGLMGIPSSSTNQTFTTTAPNTTAPNVGFVASWGMTNASAMLSWSTDVPANTVLAFGTTPALGQFTPVQAALSANHGVTLTGLNSGTIYYFVATSTGASGATGYSTLYSLATTGPPPLAPVISKLASANLTTTAATISWTTDVPSTSLVNYGTTTSYGLSVLNSNVTKAHTVTLTGLAPGTRYDFQVVSASPAGVSMFGADLTGFMVWAWGDSQTLGGADGSRNNYPAYLSTDLQVPVANEGVGGDTSTQIAQRMLATPASFSAGNCHVIWSGSNNPSQGGQILSDVGSMVNALSAPKCFLVLGVINQQVSPLGSPIYNSIISANTSLASQYGSNYLDIRGAVVQAYNPALPLDVADHARDLPPSSLRAVETLGTVTSGALDSASCVFSLSSGTQGNGTVVIIDSETILLNNVNGQNVTDCNRGYNGSAAASHAANATYSRIDGVHLGANGLQFVASQVATWFQSQSWPLCAGTVGLICPFPLNFTTAVTDTPGPVISAVAVSSITSTSAVVSWSTDQPATSLVNYGPTTNYGLASTKDPTPTTAHSVMLTGLTPNSIYNLDVVSTNSGGKSATSANATLTTGFAAAPVISGVTAANLTPNSVTITWTTDQPTTAQVNYGTTAAYGTLSPATTTLATNQAVSLTGLTPNTAYFYQVTSANSSGSSSQARTFTTPAAAATPPTVGYLAFWGVNDTGVTISWSTDVNSNTVVAYGTTAALGQIYTNTSAGYTATTGHGAVLTGLMPGTKYYFVAQSTGASGATGSSATYSFTTTGTAAANPSFTLSATAATASVGSTGTSTLTVSPLNGFNAPVTFAPSGWPAGITGTFGSSLVTISVGASVMPGPYTLTVNGTSGLLSASTTIALNVVAGSSPSFTLSATAATASVGATATSSVSVAPLSGFNSAVTLTASGWPAGITGVFGTNPATAGSIVTISVSASVAAGPYTLTVNGTSGAISKTTTIALTVTPGASVGTSANLTGLDTSAQGTWSGAYGGDGFLIANGSGASPAYANVSFGGASTYTWAGTTPDVRAVQISQGSTTRIASSYYASTSFTIGLNLTDGAAHQVAIYLLDWDTTTRAETIAITDPATGVLLDSRSFSGFHNGAYGVWNIKGTVTITVSATVGNAVVSAIFFGPASGVPLPSSFKLNGTAAAANVGSTTTSTVMIAGAGGFNSPVTLAASGWPAGITGTFGTNPATASSLVTINVGAGVAAGPYSLTVNGSSSALVASTSIALTVNGAPPQGSGTSASFAGQDATTGGLWTSKYGAAGYAIANGSSVQAPYATVGFTAALTYTWAGQTTDARALQSSRGATTGIASAYTQFSGQAFTINVGIGDGNAHTVSLYLLDWDGTSRSQTITILDAVSNAVLDTRTFSGFHDGLYASWNISGNVSIKVSPNGYVSPVVSGVFLN